MKHPGLTKRVGNALNQMVQPSTTPIVLCDDQCTDTKLLQIVAHNHAKVRGWKILTRSGQEGLQVWRVV